MRADTAFPCSADAQARVLILGSMPSQTSLRAREYYAHPANAFWPIMQSLFGIPRSLPHQQRLARLRAQRIALWDVVHQCIRPGSMDHDIQSDSVVTNDFAALYARLPCLTAICFNGRKAEQLYRRLVLPNLPLAWQRLPRHVLPSTSPANARMRFADKLQAWRLLCQLLSRTDSP